MNRFKLVFSILLFSVVASAQNLSPIKLYPEGIPNSKSAPSDYVEKNGNGWITQVTEPTLTPYLPAKGKESGAAIIVIPGGAYIGLAANHEGADVARKFAEAGVTAFLLKYRLPDDRIMQNRSIGPIQDAQRALEIVRSRAAEWNLDTAKVGVVGFSAGGHLASTLGTHYNQSFIDNKSKVSLRPSFMMLIYPVISMGEYTHEGSKQNLIGKDAKQEQTDLYSNEKQVKNDTPPVFLVHAQDDKVVPVQNSLMFYQQVLKQGGKAEMMVYQVGGHGFGMYNKGEKDQWFDRCLSWLEINGFLKK